MTAARVDGWRRAVRAGELPEDLLSFLQDVARGLVRRRALPPSFAPYGRWDDEAADEIFASWYADRLIESRQLLALLDRSSSDAGLRGLAQRSLRHHLLNAADRSQARNLFARVLELLSESPDYVVVQRASRAADTWFALVSPRGAGAGSSLWSESERQLSAHAWALGPLTVIRYRADAAKLSPVLDAAELERFVTGLMVRTQRALTPRLIMDALSQRLEIRGAEVRQLDSVPEIASARRGAAAQVELTDTARAIVASLSPRQRHVLRLGDDPVAVVAEALGCSVGTVMNERRRIGEAVTRMSGDDDERDALLNIASDLLYLPNDE